MARPHDALPAHRIASRTGKPGTRNPEPDSVGWRLVRSPTMDGCGSSRPTCPPTSTPSRRRCARFGSTRTTRSSSRARRKRRCGVSWRTPACPFPELKLRQARREKLEHAVVTDTRNPARLGEVWDLIQRDRCPITLIDHHTTEENLARSRRAGVAAGRGHLHHRRRPHEGAGAAPHPRGGLPAADGHLRGHRRSVLPGDLPDRPAGSWPGCSSRAAPSTGCAAGS